MDRGSDARANGPIADALPVGARSRVARGWAWFQRHPYVAGAVLYGAFVAVVFRDGGLGSSSTLPQGGNALNTWLIFGFYQHHPLGMWLFPFTDWGQPFGGFTGPTVLTPAILFLNPTVLVRLIEFLSLIGAGLGMMFGVRSIGGSAFGGLVGGFYYMLMAQTSQFFEGHVAAMISIALAPPFLITLWQLLKHPTARAAVAPALLLYLLVSIGDLGMLYFYLFFAVLLAAYTIVQRQVVRHYSLRELGAIVAAAALVAALSISWLYPFLAGIRPEYTTNITVQVLPFRLTAPENIVYSFSGFVQEDAFIHFSYGQFAYGPWGNDLLPASLAIPLALTAYALYGRHRDRMAVYASALLAIVFSTGDLYPGLSQINEFAYDHVPYFNSIPAMFRWLEYSLLIYGVLLGKLVSGLEHDADLGYPRVRALWRRVLSALGRSPTAPAAAGERTAGKRRIPAGVAKRAGVAGIALAIVVVVIVQNVAVITEPPSTFQFPAEYTASIGFLSHQPLSGEVLAVPFGAIYERTPWGGVSASSAYVTPYYTGADTAIFEAGTPYSLATDTFISNGITYGGSRNMTKFLGSANVQYIVATDYPNWAYSSSAISPSALSFYSLGNETGLGPVTNVSPIQSIYAQDNWAGNLSYHPSYLLYFVPDSTLYSILDSPWYPGPAMALVNGSSVGSELSEFIDHASGIVVAPGSVVTLGAGAIAQARAEHVPIIEVVSPSEFQGNGTQVRADAWNATGGQDLQFDRENSSAQTYLAANLLAAAGYTNLTLSAQIAAPPGSSYRVTIGNTTVEHAWTGSALLSAQPVNDSAAGFFVAGEANRTINSSRFLNVSVLDGTTYANWTPAGNATDFQYLSLGLHNLSAWDGFAVDVTGSSLAPLQARIGAGTKYFELWGYPTIVPTDPSTFQYRFLFPSGGFGMPADLLQNLGNLSFVQIGVPLPGYNDSLVVSNVTLLDVSTPRLSPATIGNIPATATNLSISLPPTGRLGFLELSTGAYPVAQPFDRDLLPQAGPTEMSIAPATSGWGVITLAQTFSTFWRLDGPGEVAPAVVDVGLTGWLVNSTPGAEWHVTYLGDSLESTSLVFEVVAVPLIAVPLALVAYRPGVLLRRRTGRPD
jgi:hypothetical protein